MKWIASDGDDVIVRMARATYDTMTREPLSRAELDRIAAGTHPIKIWRARKGMTLRAISEVSGTSIPQLSAIEQGHRIGTVAHMRGIAMALGVSLEDVLPPA